MIHEHGSIIKFTETPPTIWELPDDNEDPPMVTGRPEPLRVRPPKKLTEIGDLVVTTSYDPSAYDRIQKLFTDPPEANLTFSFQEGPTFLMSGVGACRAGPFSEVRATGYLSDFRPDEFDEGGTPEATVTITTVEMADDEEGPTNNRYVRSGP